MRQIIKDFKDGLKSLNKKTKGYATPAEVVRVEGGTAWVHFPGGVDETPVRLTMDAKPGDTVQVRCEGGRAWLTGNKTAPPTDDATANQAKSIANGALDSAEVAAEAAGRAVNSAYQAEQSAAAAQTSAENAYNAAVAAQSSADSALVSLATVEDVVGVLNWITAHGTMTANGSAALDPSKVYFVRDAAGDYEVGSYHYSIVSEPKAEDRTSYYTLSVDESVQNYVATHVAVNTEGMWLIPDQNGTPTTNGKKILIATGAGSSYTTAGTYIIDRSSGVDNVVAKFLGNGTTINGPNGTQIVHLGYGAGSNGSSVTESPYYTLGTRRTVNVYSSSLTYAVGDLCYRNVTSPIPYQMLYQCKTAITTAEAWNSNHWTELGAVIGNYSVIEGTNNVGGGSGSHTEGFDNINQGADTHVEGSDNIVRGTSSSDHVEGSGHRLSNSGRNHVHGYSHVLQMGSETSCLDCLVGGVGHSLSGVRANTVIGKYATYTGGATYENPWGDHAFKIGKGTSKSARSDALTVDWSGNVNIASGAKYKINGSNLSASDVGAVPTSRKVNNKALSSDITLSASDVGAVPTTRKVNGKALSSDITISAADVGLVTGSYVYNSTATDTITFQDANVNGKSFIICGCQDAGNPILRASLSGNTITVYLSGPVTIMRINYICF